MSGFGSAVNTPSLLASLVAVIIVLTIGASVTFPLSTLRSTKIWFPSLAVLIVALGASAVQLWESLLLAVSLPTGTKIGTLVAASSALAYATIIRFKIKLKSALAVVRLMGVILTVAVPVALIVPKLKVVNWHSDSIQHLAISRALTEQRYDEISVQLKEMRGLSFSPFMSLAVQWGGQYGYLFAPIIGWAFLVSLAHLVFLISKNCYDLLPSSRDAGLRSGSTDGKQAMLQLLVYPGLAASVPLIAALSDRFQFHLFYLNSHLLFGIQCIALALLIEGSRSTWERESPTLSRVIVALPLLILMAGIVLTRAEGQLVIAPLVLSMLLGLRRHHLAYGIGILMLLVILVKAKGSLGLGLVPSLTSREMLFQASLVLAAFVVRLGGFSGLAWRLLSDARIALASVLVFALASSNIRGSISIAWENLFNGAGSWGPSFYLLALVSLIVAVVIPSSPNGCSGLDWTNPSDWNCSGWAVRVLAIWYFPIMLATHELRGGSGRLGHNDSFNRAAVSGLMIVGFMVVARVYHATELDSSGSNEKSE